MMTLKSILKIYPSKNIPEKKYDFSMTRSEIKSKAEKKDS